MLSERLEKKITRENLWIYILSLLKEKPRYGYELRGAIRKRFGFLPGNVTAYRVLYSLKRHGFVRVVESPKEKRKYYEITEQGRREMKRAKEVIKTLLSRM